MTPRRFVAAITVATALLGGMAAPRAQDLRLGIALETDSLDPHFHWFGATIGLTRQIYDPLVAVEADGRVVPLLATSWHPVGDHAWAFELRPDAKFSDGTALTPDDIAFTFQRARDVPNSPTGFGSYLLSVASVQTTGPHSIVVHTKGPSPLLPQLLSSIEIVSRHAGAGATTADYNSMKAAIGTGPFRPVAWERGGSLTLARNEHYWGPKPDWAIVHIRYIPNPGSRLGALLAGDVDLIDQVSGTDVVSVSANPAYRVTHSVSYAIVGFLPDVTARPPPFITENDGTAPQQNPLADLRVRQAIDMAIDRKAIAERLMAGQAVPATQIMLPGQYGYDPSLLPTKFDPAGAKAKLAAAGYSSGFHMAVHCQLRFYNADGFCQAVAQMLTHVGIHAEPVTMPHSMYVTHSIQHEYSFGTAFSLVDMGDPSTPLIGNSATYGGANGWGSSNRGRYSNPALDSLLARAQAQIDPSVREDLLRQATRIVIRDEAFIPVFRPMNIEAMRSVFVHQPATEGYVFAAEVHRSEAAPAVR
jgi:peptide/nickel transport system substrate-binding protein